MILLRRLLLAGCLAAALPALADAGFGGGGQDFLDVDEAFQPAVERTGGNELAVTWNIAPGYYLYRHAFEFALVDAGDAKLGRPEIPAGERHQDEFFGEVETYRDLVTVTLPVEGRLPETARLQIGYQGCADAGLCYPPQSRLLPVSSNSGGGGGSDDSADGFVNEQDRLAARLAEGKLGWVILSFVGLGLLLAFTPCVLPMLPILSGLIVGAQRAQDRRGTAALRGFSLSGVYVLAMAAAYTLFGILAGLAGTNLQAALQSPWVLVPFALVFVGLALAMFGVYQLQMPAAWQSRLNEIGGGRPGLRSAAVLGFLSALIVGPCLAPPLAGALLYIGSSGDPVLGGAALFALGLGMGLPLIALGTLGGGILPRPGPWMDQVRVFFGVVLIGVAIWLLGRILPGPLTLALWAALLAGYAAHLGVFQRAPEDRPVRRLAQGAGFLGLVYAAILLVGAAGGGQDPLRPLQPWMQAAEKAGSPFKHVANERELKAALAAAKNAGRPAIVDFYADWCVECVHMERQVFPTPEVRAALADVTALQVDVTAYDAADRALMRHYDVIGPPTILFFGPDGRELRRYRLVGEVDAAGFVSHLERALRP